METLENLFLKGNNYSPQTLKELNLRHKPICLQPDYVNL